MKWKNFVAVLSAIMVVGAVYSAHVKRNALASNPSAESEQKQPNAPSSMGQWSFPINLGMVPIHAAMLYTGQALFWEYLDGTGQKPGTIAILFNPANNQVTPITTAPIADYFCSGASHLADGRLLIDGGLTGPLGKGDFGTSNVTIFDPATSLFTTSHSMYYARYYPTNISLPTGLQLVMSGEDGTGKIVPALEEYNPTLLTWTRLPGNAALPKTIGPVWGDYPRNYLMPSGKVFVTNQLNFTYLFDPISYLWTLVGNFNYVNRFHGAGVLLPSLQQVMEVGGQPVQGAATNTTEIIDFTQQLPSWQYAAPMTYARHDMNAINLPDGTILVVGGASGEGKYANPVEQAEIYTPATNTWATVGSQLGNRGYHSTALLLPDGRVVSAGSDSGNTYQNYAEIYSPPYLFNGTRPTITSAPATITYGQVFSISTPQDATIASVALIRQDATTHADHMDQRMQNLTFSDLGSGTLQITAPQSANYAPPGYYMLFILNSSGVPSVSAIMQINSTNSKSSKQKPSDQQKH